MDSALKIIELIVLANPDHDSCSIALFPIVREFQGVRKDMLKRNFQH